MMNADGTNQVNLTNNPGYDADPTWSPNGQRIAFASWRDDIYFRLFVMNADGSEQQQFHERKLGGWLFPDWSPDGKWIVVGTRPDRQKTDVNLLLFNVEKKTYQDLCNDPGCNSFARWSPDGRYVAFAHFAAPPPDYHPNDPLDRMLTGDLMIFDGDTNSITMLAKGAVPGWGPRPSWKPNPPAATGN
jgi:Tol biopolymer transport system component